MDLKLVEAAENEDIELVRLLIDSGEPIDKQDKDGRTPLMVAVQKNNVELVKLLLRRGADVNKRDISANPDYFFYLYHKSNYLRELGKHEEAVEAMDKAIKVDINNPLYVFHKAQSLALMKRYSGAFVLLEEVVKVKPTEVYMKELETVKKAANK
ncbi:MAG TPA: hypothetical protein GX707_05665 [Epulopiscium sp.]|nr:hypothetical protein [Candidatus Epulonipiscium sp.]